jgi:hypothetical protein
MRCSRHFYGKSTTSPIILQPKCDFFWLKDGFEAGAREFGERFLVTKRSLLGNVYCKAVWPF